MSRSSTTTSRDTDTEPHGTSQNASSTATDGVRRTLVLLAAIGVAGTAIFGLSRWLDGPTVPAVDEDPIAPIADEDPTDEADVPVADEDPTDEADVPVADEPADEEAMPDDGAAAPPDEDAAPAELADGRHPVYLHEVDVTARTLRVDLVQFLTGDEASQAFLTDNPGETEGPPNDYYIVNDNPRLRTALVADDVIVELVRLEEDGNAELDPGTFEELPDYLSAYVPAEGPALSYNPFWVTVEAGQVTAIQEQYLP